MKVIAIIQLAIRLLTTAGSAIAAGRSEVTEAELDAALADLDVGDERLSDAIRRRREREAGDN